MALYMTDLPMVRDILCLEEFDTKFDSAISRLIAAVSAQAEVAMNRKALVVSGDIEYFDVYPGNCRFLLPRYPVTSVASVYNDWDRTFGSSTLIDSGDYDIEEASGILTIDKVGLTPGAGALKVTYTGGMGASTSAFMAAYPAIAGAVATEVAFRFQNRQTIGKIAVTMSSGSVTLGSNKLFLDSVQEVFDMYRRN